MPERAVATPVWVKLLVAAALVGPATWWLADRRDRLANQGRLAEIASAIARRPVEVHCPGPLARMFMFETLDGSVAFDGEGRPHDETSLREAPCAELDALAEGRRTAPLDCLERSTSCGDDAQSVAWAVDVLTHESWHLRGILDEAETECRSLQTMAWAAQRLGATPAQARGLAELQFETGYHRLPERYRSGDCVDGGRLDLRPTDPAWP